MSQTQNDSNKPNLGSAFNKAFSIGGQVAFVNLFVIFVGLGLGLWLDKLFGSKPTITLILVLGSMPLSLVLTYYLAKHEAQSLSQPKKRDESTIREEKHSGE